MGSINPDCKKNLVQKKLAEDSGCRQEVRSETKYNNKVFCENARLWT